LKVPVRTPGFFYRSQARSTQLSMLCESQPLEALARRYGTPLYVYSAEIIRSRYRALEKAFHGIPHDICYSVKANSNLSLLRLLAGLGSGFDIVSGGELQRVLRITRRRAATIVFSGVGKTEAEMDAALRAGILMFNVESESELQRLATRAARLKKTARFSLRVNPDIKAETHPYISTGLREHKFGVPIGDALRLYRAAAKHRYLQVYGVSVHIGSQITSMQPFAACMGRVADLVRELQAMGCSIACVDAGGGLGIPYHHGEEDATSTAQAYAKAIMRPLHGMKLRLLVEPGRSIVGPAGVLLARVLYLKRNGSKQFAVVDAGMNDLLRPALYDAFHEIIPVTFPPNTNEPVANVLDVVGPVCESGDFFARDREMPTIHEGDLLAILDAGAYGMALASNYNSRPRPAEILVDGKKAIVARKRETTQSLFALAR
jgi:diaminopimelate decarboxylase